MKRASGWAILLSMLLFVPAAWAQAPVIASFLPATRTIIGIPAQVEFTLTISSPAPGAIVVSLSVNPADVVFVPGEVVVPEG
jgi:hypothetical protein